MLQLQLALLVSCLALLVGIAQSVTVPPRSQWASLVATLEGLAQPFETAAGGGGPYSSSALPLGQESLAERHIPELSQFGWSSFTLRSPHEMDWDGEPDDGADHVIEFAYVKDGATGAVLYFAVLEPGDNRVSLLVHFDTDAFPQPALLVPFAWCNQHGLWRGAALETVDARSWNQTVASLDASAARSVTMGSDSCPATQLGGAARIALDSSHAIAFRVLDADGGPPLDVVADGRALEVSFFLPRGGFMGLGFGPSMLGTDMVVAAEAGGVAACGDFFTDSRVDGPQPDAQRDVELTRADIGASDALVVCVRPLAPGDAGDAQLVLAEGKVQNMVFAYGVAQAAAVAATAPALSRAALAYHGLNQRGYLDADLSALGFGGVVTVARARDRRDLKVVHGVVMYSIWGINMCVGGMVARYQRHTAWWVGAHKLLQALSTILTLPVFFLTRAFVEPSERLASPHAYLGYFIVFGSWLQAFVGSVVFASRKFSKALHKQPRHDGKLRPDTEALLDVVASKYGPLHFLRGVVLEAERLDPKEDAVRVEALGLVDAFVAKALPAPLACVPTRWVVAVLAHFQHTIARPVHKNFGRTLIIVAYVQIFLGLEKLDVNRFVDSMVIAWTAVVGAVLIYKELELSCALPRGFGPKIAAVCNMSMTSPQEHAEQPKPSSPQEHGSVRRQESVVVQDAHSFKRTPPEPAIQEPPPLVERTDGTVVTEPHATALDPVASFHLLVT